MPPFKRTAAKFTGDIAVGNVPLDNYTGEVAEIVRKVVAANDDHDGIYEVRLGGVVRRVYGDDLFPHPDAPPSNEEFIGHLFAWSSSPLVHAFIFDAITKHADKLLADPEAVRTAMAGHFVHPDAWLGAAKEARDAVEAHTTPPAKAA